MKGSQFPYKNIGHKLKKWREDLHESLAEVSGAVEIDTDLLKKIEDGKVLPSEDILTLLISHLDVHEYEARQILDQAGYGNNSPIAEDQMLKQMLMVIPFDNRILYAEATKVHANKNGIVLEFMQGTGDKQTPVTRIGMSQDHLERLTRLMQDTLTQLNKPKKLYLPPPETNDK